uniref:Mucolipin-3 n=1 Tax=Phallusia mammillata TaxID=59560 RepID=A0A6F9DKH7_9ASCI|nr:mucolipin-3 [Phallusia mammillata]
MQACTCSHNAINGSSDEFYNSCEVNCHCNLLRSLCCSFGNIKQRIKMWRRNSSNVSLAQQRTNCCNPEARLRKELKYFFLNPCDKYRARKRKPYKLAIQIFKIAMITVQLIIFGQSNQHVVSFMNDNIEGLKKIVMPPNSEIFTVEELSSQIYHIRQQYEKLKNSSLGVYGYAKVDKNEGCVYNNSVQHHNLCFCLKQYRDINLKNLSFEFDSKFQNSFCTFLKPWSEKDVNNISNSIPLKNGTMFDMYYEGIITVKLLFAVKTALLVSPRNPELPECFKVATTILFDNTFHSGKVTRSLNTTFSRVECDNKIHHEWFTGRVVAVFVFDCAIVVICVISILLCCRSIWRAQRLRWSFQRFYFVKNNKKLDWWERTEFFNGWYFLIVVSDVLTIAGSISKIVNDFQWVGVLDYNACSLFLGLGCLCVWIGVLRYVGYFHQYNILVLTMKRSLPHVLRFMVCASILYLGFMFCGWVVLGPYHHKFRNPIVTSEALFSLINGDDMYMTYEEMPRGKVTPWVFSQIYLYTFISLFIYIVLSLFIAVIMETYETIKEWQANGFPPQTELQKFINSGLDQTDDGYTNADTYCCCCLYHNDHPDILIIGESDDEHLIA